MAAFYEKVVRDFGDSETAIRLVAIDCRASRGLGDEHRVLVDDHEWAWITERATQQTVRREERRVKALHADRARERDRQDRED